MEKQKQSAIDKGFVKVAHLYALEFSKCQFTKVAAIAVNERGRIVATGTNGTIRGQVNCNEVSFGHRDDHVQFTLDNEIHAEANLLLEMLHNKVDSNQLTMYITISPCEECLKLILGSGKFRRIVYDNKYHRTSEESLQAMKRKCEDLDVEFVEFGEKVYNNGMFY